jgi:hypothetical protein
MEWAFGSTDCLPGCTELGFCLLLQAFFWWLTNRRTLTKNTPKCMLLVNACCWSGDQQRASPPLQPKPERCTHIFLAAYMNGFAMRFNNVFANG